MAEGRSVMGIPVDEILGRTSPANHSGVNTTSIPGVTTPARTEAYPAQGNLAPITYGGTNGYQYAAGGYHAKGYRSCGGHSGQKSVYEYADGTTLGGASSYKLQATGVDLILDASGAVKINPFIRTLPVVLEKMGWGVLKTLEIAPPVVTLDWPDGDPPTVGPIFWRQLRGLFVPQWHVVCCCVGGHGRTGTMLASLLIEDGVAAVDAIDHVRKNHCQSAVENKDQEDYLYWLEEQFIEIDCAPQEEPVEAGDDSGEVTVEVNG